MPRSPTKQTRSRLKRVFAASTIFAKLLGLRCCRQRPRWRAGAPCTVAMTPYSIWRSPRFPSREWPKAASSLWLPSTREVVAKKRTLVVQVPCDGSFFDLRFPRDQPVHRLVDLVACDTCYVKVYPEGAALPPRRIGPLGGGPTTWEQMSASARSRSRHAGPSSCLKPSFSASPPRRSDIPVGQRARRHQPLPRQLDGLFGQVREIGKGSVTYLARLPAALAYQRGRVLPVAAICQLYSRLHSCCRM